VPEDCSPNKPCYFEVVCTVCLDHKSSLLVPAVTHFINTVHSNTPKHGLKHKLSVLIKFVKVGNNKVLLKPCYVKQKAMNSCI
jgi:hypothetical protein